MSIWTSLKFWSADAMMRGTVEAVSSQFRRAQQVQPERDCHAWLYHAYASRPGYRPGQNVGLIVPFTRTTLYSVLDPSEAPVALAYALLLGEMPTHRARVEPALRTLLTPVYNLVRQGRFPTRWEAANPWTCANVSGMRESVHYAYGPNNPDTGQPWGKEMTL